VTREITSGLIVGLNGWVSGDGMVTMTVSATVSKRGSDTSSSTGDPPPTSERVVSTQVRTSSGKPVIIGGLLQKETNRSVKKVPLLGDIPILGWLFKDVVSSEEDTEFVLYVVPHISWGDADTAMERDGMERYYQSYVRDFIK
jgi:type II secretory pathway component GspD/PulD (secretin)